MGLKFKKIEVGPHQAGQLLAQSISNRPIQRHVVGQYAREMELGTWYESPEPLVIDDKGHLVNGHHRLNAVIESGCTVTFWLSEGLVPKTVPKLDGGAARSMAERPARSQTVSATTPTIAPSTAWHPVPSDGSSSSRR